MIFDTFGTAKIHVEQHRKIPLKHPKKKLSHSYNVFVRDKIEFKLFTSTGKNQTANVKSKSWIFT